MLSLHLVWCENKLIIIVIIIIIIGPHPIHTGKCVRICVSVWVLMLPRRGRLLHPRVNVQAMWFTSSLLALVCQVTCDRYYTCSSCRLSLGASWPCSSAYMMASSPSAPNFFFHMYWKRSEHLASFPGSPGPLLFSLFSWANITHEKSKEKESLVRNRAHLWPPWPAMTMITAATHSIVHSAALALPCGSYQHC